MVAIQFVHDGTDEDTNKARLEKSDISPLSERKVGNNSPGSSELTQSESEGQS